MMWTAHLMIAVAAAALSYAGCAKLGALSAVVPTMQQLGLPVRFARATVVVLSVAEVATAGLLVLDGGPLAAAAVTVLALLFAVAGVRALVAGRAIACSCWGTVHRASVLGWRQVAMLGIWLPVAGLTLMATDPTLVQRLLLANCVALVVAMLALWQVVPKARASRALRQALGPVA